ncbi:hypothetical protein ACIGW3_02215 [Streptomyces sp. NPDC053499]|uniref:hypothetical protein n=1 Tax=Streptomyces sp. NPDC053499 TaxID=3365707 RepID=UPI0037D24EB4
MRAALSTWNARVCGVAPSSVAARRGVALLPWTKGEGVLSFDAPGFVLTLAQKVDHLPSSAARAAYELPALDEVGNRLPLLGLSLKAITLVNGGGKVAYDGEVDALHWDRLRLLSESLGPGTLVKTLEAALPPSGVPVRYNFSTRTASVKPPRGSVPLLELVNTSIRLFTDPSHADEERLVEVIPSGGCTLHAGIDHDMPGTEPPRRLTGGGSAVGAPTRLHRLRLRIGGGAALLRVAMTRQIARAEATYGRDAHLTLTAPACWPSFEPQKPL